MPVGQEVMASRTGAAADGSPGSPAPDDAVAPVGTVADDAPQNLVGPAEAGPSRNCRSARGRYFLHFTTDSRASSASTHGSCTSTRAP